MTADTSELLVRYDDFSGGHYGAVGARRCDKNQWGGLNMLYTRDGSLAPASASRPLRFSNLADGRIRGLHWAYGVDGMIYFVQDNVDDPGTYKVRRFEPTTASTITVEDVGDLDTLERKPDWIDLGGKVYLTIWSDTTYEIDPAGPSMAGFTQPGTFGELPGGRAIAAYGERIYVGGINDARFNGDRGNRIVYTEPPQSDFEFDADSFFDAGADLKEIGALATMGDTLVIILEDQQFYTFRGVPGVGSTLRRAYGFHKGTGGIANFENDNAATDPSQTRVWFYDHVSRGPAAFSGASVSRQTQFGSIAPDRTGEGRIEGTMTVIGAPGEFFMDRVPMPRTEGDSASGDALELVRIGGAYGLVQRRVVAGR